MSADRYLLDGFSVFSSGTFGVGLEFACSVELERAGDSGSFGRPAGYPDELVPVLVCA
jgi:hypothetical protein